MEDLLKGENWIGPKGRKHSQTLQGVGWETSGFFPPSLMLLPVGDEILAPCLAFSDTTTIGRLGYMARAQQEGESRLLTFAGRSRGGAAAFSCGVWCLE